MTSRALELRLDGGRSVFGEVREAEDAPGAALLLHDRGQDLDAMRPFAAPLQALGLTTVLVDLPGHGLSDGDWEQDGSRAVQRALVECRTLGSLVGVVAAGAACSVLYGLHPSTVRVVALAAPRLTAGDLAGGEAWRLVPAMTMGDPCDVETAASLMSVSRWIRAWSLSLSVHYLDPPHGGPAAWTPQMTHSSAAFIAEQIAYAARGHEVVAGPQAISRGAAPVPGDEATGPIGPAIVSRGRR